MRWAHRPARPNSSSAADPDMNAQFDESQLLLKHGSGRSLPPGPQPLGLVANLRSMSACERSVPRVSYTGTPVKGHILLQDHGNQIWFRKVEIRTAAK